MSLRSHKTLTYITPSFCALDYVEAFLTQYVNVGSRNPRLDTDNVQEKIHILRKYVKVFLIFYKETNCSISK